MLMKQLSSCSFFIFLTFKIKISLMKKLLLFSAAFIVVNSSAVYAQTWSSIATLTGMYCRCAIRILHLQLKCMKINFLLFFILYLAIIHTTKSQDSKLWAATNTGGVSNEGTIINMNLDGSDFTVAYHFHDETGSNPVGDLVQLSDGKIYGVCYSGGIYGSCVIYEYDPITGIFADVYDFGGPLATDADFPASGLVQYTDGKLYGVTESGGLYTNGVIYSYDPMTKVYSNLYHLTNSDGNVFVNPMIVEGSLLYGVSTSGTAEGIGGIFSFDPVQNIFKQLFTFNESTGFNAHGRLVSMNMNLFYGLTNSAGANGYGGIFSYNYLTGDFQNLHNFDVLSSLAIGSMILASNGKLYGTTINGGDNGAGVIFSFDPVNNIYTPVFSFLDSISGINSYGSLIQASNGYLYGSTTHGGALGHGVIFYFDINDNSFHKLKDAFASPINNFLEVFPTTSAQQPEVNDSRIRIFPNPVSGNLTVVFPKFTQTPELILMNVIGQQLPLKKSEMAVSEIQLDMQGLSKGVYFLKALINGESMVVKIQKK